MSKMRVIGYLRLDCTDVEIARSERDEQTQLLRAYCRRSGQELAGLYIDRHGLRRARLRELERALAACRQEEARLVVPRLGRLDLDPAFFEALGEAAVEFLILDRPQITPETVLAHGVQRLRSDPRGRR